jgi:hypothetical protein
VYLNSKGVALNIRKARRHARRLRYLNADILVDARVRIVRPRDFQLGDFDGDGDADDHRYLVVYAFANAQFLHPRILAIVDDYNGDGTIDRLELSIP